MANFPNMNPIAQLTAESTLKGVWRSVKNESGVIKKVATFLGIPYAEPPVNERRFAPPMQLKLWHGARSAEKLGAFCPQDIRATRATYYPFPLEDNMNEDCLYINVWTPNVDKTARLPVMVWIYGGAFIQGCSDYFDGTVISGRHDVVYVSFNYRVGAFGFMCMNDNIIPGNMGFLDQVEALRWVKRYISSFGGDADNVTVFGESAGSISISALLTSSHVRGQGLFRRAILESGSCFYYSCCWNATDAKKYAMQKLKRMGADNITTGREAVEFLRNKSSQEIVSGMGLGLLPVLDGNLFTNRCQLEYKAGNFEPVDVIIGFNTHEGAAFIKMFLTTVPELNRSIAEEYVKSLVYKVYYRHHPKADIIYATLMKEYLRDVTEPEILHKALVELFGDLLFITPAINNALAHSSKARTYLYQFDHRPFFSQYPDWVSADHGNEIPYVIGEPFLGRVPEDVWSETEQNISKTVMKYWTNFAKTGNPNSAGLQSWPLYSNQSREMLVIGEVTSLCSNYSPSRTKLWLNDIQNLDPEIIINSQL